MSSKRTQDEFTHLHGTVSRQRLWQMRRKRDGCCPRCGHKKPDGIGLCVECLVENRERARSRQGCKRRYRSKSYLMEGAEE